MTLKLKLIAGAAIVAAFLLLLGWVYARGGDGAVAKGVKQQANKVVEHGKKEAEVMRLGDDDLDKRYSRWLRDRP